jgi:serine/threonine protein kinase
VRMALATGSRLGPYEIVSPLGTGGMGEFYRARDTRLKRDVAIKVLPDVFSKDPERLARFQREAEVLAALNHSNIAAVYGLEKAEGITGLVLELVVVDTLADLIARGPIPVADALPIARQIADALEAAHEKGVVHRDLKPANVKITPEGKVKVLDFGLAKMLEPEPPTLVGRPDSIMASRRSRGIGSTLLTRSARYLGSLRQFRQFRQFGFGINSFSSKLFRSFDRRLCSKCVDSLQVRIAPSRARWRPIGCRPLLASHRHRGHYYSN